MSGIVQDKKYRDRQKRKDLIITIFIGIFAVIWMVPLLWTFFTSLREAAAIDGATEWQTFRKVVFPAMKPVNTIIIVITVIESLRAFDLIYIIYGTSTGWPILGMLVFVNIYGQAASMLGAAYAVILFLLSIIPIVFYLRTVFRDDVA